MVKVAPASSSDVERLPWANVLSVGNWWSGWSRLLSVVGTLNERRAGLGTKRISIWI